MPAGTGLKVEAINPTEVGLEADGSPLQEGLFQVYSHSGEGRGWQRLFLCLWGRICLPFPKKGPGNGRSFILR